MRGLAHRYGWVTGPASQRHVHADPVPRLGGVAVFAAVSATFVLAGVAGAISHDALRGIVAPFTWLFLIGLWDDFRDLRARWKLSAQLYAGVLLFFAGLQLPIPGSSHLPHFITFGASLGLTAFWVATVCNAINLVDGLDGLASGISIIATATLGLLCLQVNASLEVLGAVILLGALAGFLLFNRHPASIFLGDSGSLGIGVLVAAFTLRVVAARPLAGSIAVLLTLAYPLQEVGFSMVRRFVRGWAVFRPDRRHFHHRLLDSGRSHPGTVRVLYVASAVASALAVVAFLGFPWLAALAGVAGIAFAVHKLRYIELNEVARTFLRIRERRARMVGNIAWRECFAAAAECNSLAELADVLGQHTAKMDVGIILQIWAQKGHTLIAPAAQPTKTPDVWTLLVRHSGTKEQSWFGVELVSAGTSYGRIELGFCDRRGLNCDLDVFAEEAASLFAPALAALVRRESIPTPKPRQHREWAPVAQTVAISADSSAAIDTRRTLLRN